MKTFLTNYRIIVGLFAGLMVTILACFIIGAIDQTFTFHRALAISIAYAPGPALLVAVCMIFYYHAKGYTLGPVNLNALTKIVLPIFLVAAILMILMHIISFYMMDETPFRIVKSICVFGYIGAALVFIGFAVIFWLIKGSNHAVLPGIGGALSKPLRAAAVGGVLILLLLLATCGFKIAQHRNQTITTTPVQQQQQSQPQDSTFLQRQAARAKSQQQNQTVQNEEPQFGDDRN